MPFSLIVAARTDTGQVRDHNEDSFLVGTDLSQGQWNQFSPEPFPLGENGALFMVADGMGGAHAGEVASELAVNSVQSLFEAVPADLDTSEKQEAFMQAVLIKAHQAISQDAEVNPGRAGMGTTAVLCWIKGMHLHLAWVGDSRAYLLTPAKELNMVSEDHSLVWEMVQEGRLTPEEARTHPQSNIITQSMGDEAHPPSPDTRTLPLAAESRLLLCSDGLNGMLPDSQIRAILADGEPANITATRLVEAANHAGGEDNITVIIIDILESSQEDGEAELHHAAQASPPASPPEDTNPGMKTQPIMEEAKPPLSHLAQTEGSPKQDKKGPSLVHLAGVVAVLVLLLFLWWLLIG